MAVFIIIKKPSDFFSIIPLNRDVSLGSGIGVGYFVIVLLQYILITPLNMKIKKASHHPTIMAAITCGALIFNYLFRIHFTHYPFAHFPYFALPFFVWYSFYHLGIFIGQGNYVDKYSLSMKAPMFQALNLLFVLASIFEGLVMSSKGVMHMAASQIKITSFLASIPCSFLLSLSIT
jgi:hypothetical protein